MMDVIKYLSNFVTDDTDKLRLMITCKDYKCLNLLFLDQYDYGKIIKSKFFNNFTNLKIYYSKIGNLSIKFPKSLNKLQINDYGTHKRFPEEKLGLNIVPSTVTHLHIPAAGHVVFLKNIPESITHLKLGRFVSISGHIPETIVELIEHPKSNIKYD